MPTARKVPGYVAEHRRMLDRMTKRRRWILRHLLPAPAAVCALIRFFTKNHERTQYNLGILHHRQSPQKVDWYARYWPALFLPIIREEERKRVYSYFLLTLRMHRATLSRPQHPDRWRDPRRRSLAHQRLRCAPDALEAVGDWWLGLAPSERSWAMPDEREALNLCARISRFKKRDLRHKGPLLRALKRENMALRWETRHLHERFAKR